MPETAHLVLFGVDAQWLSAFIFLLTYVALITERVHRTIVVLLGAGLMILTGILDQGEAVAGVDFNTIALLTGMMILVSITERCGVFQYVAVWVSKRVRAEPRGILILLATVTAVFSALFDNVTTVLLIVPVTLLIVDKLELSPYPFLFAEIFASNIGGTATLIGDPPNILIGSAVGLTFADFVNELTPVVLVIHLLMLAIFLLIWGSKLKTSDSCRARVMAFEERDSITDPRLLRQSLAVMTLVILGFTMVETVGLESGSVALIGASLLMLMYTFGRDHRSQAEAVEQILGNIEWTTLTFFVGLFVVVEGVEASGLLSVLGHKLVALTGGDIQTTTFATLWIAAVASAIIDNIPFVATMIPMLQSTASDMGGPQAMEPVWWALSLGACLGGNGTVIGASANVIVVGFAERAGHPIRFVPFMLLATPLMLLSVTVASIYLYLRNFA
jgi:Na+/H+ antiporter NhaD/arsenite permease-like protein